MKLLAWMHRKQRQNDYVGQPQLEDQQHHMMLNYGLKSARPSYREYNIKKAATIEEEYNEDTSEEASEMFHGFLAIGTLGSESNYPATPVFAASFENITENENEVTETELKLISDELEKVLAAEALELECNFSSGRNSHVSNVSNGRSSHASTITLSGKPLESTEGARNSNITCPLQGYLFGSALEVQTCTVPKKEHRATLGELFQRTKSEDCCKEKYERSGKAEKSAIQLMKKIVKKTKLHGSAKNSNASSGGSDETAHSETKLAKILQMFQRKVHPESKLNLKNLKQFGNKNALVGINGESMTADRNLNAAPKRSMQGLMIQQNHTQCGDLNENGEYWIRTDAEYLVLEL